MKQLEQYCEWDVASVRKSGVSQEGYESILSFDTWKEQRCKDHSKRVRVELGELKCDVDCGFSLAELEAFISEVKGHSETSEVMFDYDIDGRYGDDGLGDIHLMAYENKTVANEEVDYLKSYSRYVDEVNKRNKATWETYKDSKRYEELVQRFGSDYLKYLELEAKFAHGNKSTEMRELMWLKNKLGK